MKLATDIMVLCDHAFLTQDNKLSMIGLFDQMYVQKFPGGIAKGYLVATVNGTPNQTYKIDVKLTKKNTPENLLTPIQLSGVTAPNGKTNILVELINLVFKEPGKYEFALLNDNQVVGSTQLEVLDVGKKKGQKAN